MDLTIHLVSKQNLPLFVFAKEEANVSSVTTDSISETPLKPNNHQHNSTDEKKPEEQNNQQNDKSRKDTHGPSQTPLLSSPKKSLLDEALPSDNISPFKRTRIS